MIACGDPDLDINDSVGHRAAQVDFCFLFRDAGRHDALQRIRKRLPFRAVCQPPPPSPPTNEVGAGQHLGGGEVRRVATRPRARMKHTRFVSNGPSRRTRGRTRLVRSRMVEASKHLSRELRYSP